MIDLVGKAFEAFRVWMPFGVTVEFLHAIPLQDDTRNPAMPVPHRLRAAEIWPSQVEVDRAESGVLEVLGEFGGSQD